MNLREYFQVKSAINDTAAHYKDQLFEELTKNYKLNEELIELKQKYQALQAVHSDTIKENHQLKSELNNRRC